jgi:hypothetical protein
LAPFAMQQILEELGTFKYISVVFYGELWFPYGTEHFYPMLILVYKLVLSFLIFSKNTLSFWHIYGISFPNCTYIKTFTFLQWLHTTQTEPTMRCETV